MNMQAVADKYCVYRNEIHHSIGEFSQIYRVVSAAVCAFDRTV